jgi:hypothetical protein
VFDAAGLTRVTTEDLKKALRNLYQGHLRCPVTMENLTRVGLQHCAGDFLAMARQLDEAGFRALIVGVVAERLARQGGIGSKSALTTDS